MAQMVLWGILVRVQEQARHLQNHPQHQSVFHSLNVFIILQLSMEDQFTAVLQLHEKVHRIVQDQLPLPQQHRTQPQLPILQQHLRRHRLETYPNRLLLE